MHRRWLIPVVALLAAAAMAWSARAQQTSVLGRWLSQSGKGVIDSQQPFLSQVSAGSDNTIRVISSSTNVRYYDLVNGAYV